MLGVLQEWKSRKDGHEHFGACPIHVAKRNTTSFSFDEAGRFHCFSCGAKGRGAIDLVMAVKGVGFQEAVSLLRTLQVSPSRVETGNLERPIAKTSLLCVEADASPVLVRQKDDDAAVLENPAYKASYEKFKIKSDWLRERGLSEEVCERFGVFQYENPKRQSPYNGQIFISIRRFRDGEVVGYLVRFRQPADQKYLWPKGVSKSLEVFGAYQIAQQLPPGGRLKQAFLVESPFAVLKFAQLGLPAVSCYGWSVSPQQIEILQSLSKGWIFLPDLNVRNQVSQPIALLSQACWVKCPEFPGTDPEHLTEEQVRLLG